MSGTRCAIEKAVWLIKALNLNIVTSMWVPDIDVCIHLKVSTPLFHKYTWLIIWTLFFWTWIFIIQVLEIIIQSNLIYIAPFTKVSAIKDALQTIDILIISVNSKAICACKMDVIMRIVLHFSRVTENVIVSPGGVGVRVRVGVQ